MFGSASAQPIEWSHAQPQQFCERTGRPQDRYFPESLYFGVAAAIEFNDQYLRGINIQS